MDQRKEIRLCNSYTTLIELAADSPLGDAAVLAICHSVDVSSDGLQVTVGQEVEPGRILPLAIFADHNEPGYFDNDTERPHRFNLVAEVVWSRPTERSDKYRMGLKLLPSSETELVQWKLWVLKLLKQSEPNQASVSRN